MLENPWIPDGTPGWADGLNHRIPTDPQALLYMSEVENVLFGGAAGPGKSEALLVAALQYADLPNHAAIIVRRHYTDLAQPGALMDRASEWLRGRAHWNQQTHTYTFPSGYKLAFGALDNQKMLDKFQGAQVQSFFIDEAGQIPKKQRHWLRTRMRRPDGSVIPLRFWEASNPDGVGEMDLYHEYVEPWMTNQQDADHLYIPADLSTNPHVDPEYRERLMKLDPVTRKKYLRGEWGVRPEGLMFDPTKIHRIRRDDVPSDFDALVRVWDLAATKPSDVNPDPDWTRGALVGQAGAMRFILDMKSLRNRHYFVKELIRETARADGREVFQVVPQDPAQAGKSQAEEYRELLSGLTGVSVLVYRPVSSKEEMAKPVSASVDAGDVYVVEAPWTDDLINELSIFPKEGAGIHDDQVDVLGAAWFKLPKAVRYNDGRRMKVGVPLDDEDAPAASGRPKRLNRPKSLRR